MQVMAGKYSSLRFLAPIGRSTRLSADLPNEDVPATSFIYSHGTSISTNERAKTFSWVLSGV